jgi:hypothetical protein
MALADNPTGTGTEKLYNALCICLSLTSTAHTNTTVPICPRRPAPAIPGPKLAHSRIAVALHHTLHAHKHVRD